MKALFLQVSALGWPILVLWVCASDFWHWKKGKSKETVVDYLGQGLFFPGFLTLLMIIYPWESIGHLGRTAMQLALILFILRAGVLAVAAWRIGNLWLYEHRWRATVYVLLGVVFFSTAIYALAPHRPEGGVGLSFPLEGEWYVGQGGANVLVNFHRRVLSQQYALDLVKLGPEGRSFRGSGKDVTSFEAWNQPVYAPADGMVIEAVDSFPDNPPGVEDKRDTRGNHVIIQLHDGTEVLLAHLRQGSLAATTGERVRKGQLIGRVGNSGNTAQPHLHIDATRMFDGQRVGVPMYFYDVGQDQAFPRRGQTIKQVEKPNR
jgi:hypothetical protein